MCHTHIRHATEMVEVTKMFLQCTHQFKLFGILNKITLIPSDMVCLSCRYCSDMEMHWTLLQALYNSLLTLQVICCWYSLSLVPRHELGTRLVQPKLFF